MQYILLQVQGARARLTPETVQSGGMVKKRVEKGGIYHENSAPSSKCAHSTSVLGWPSIEV